jgi:deoxyadenosine/deoxycytidine kinase
MSGPERFRHIAVEGPIGVGKTSLARRLAQHLAAELMLERPQDNPFLERFYDDGTGYALQAQLSFLFQRVKQIQSLAQPGMFSHSVVSDFMFAKDALFARLNLSDDEYRLYRQMYAQVEPQVPEPDLILWLQAGPPTLLRRIRQRGIAMEQRISIDYLARICEAYVDYFRGYLGAPVLAIDTEAFKPSLDDDFERLLEALAGFRGGPGLYELNTGPQPNRTTGFG